ncbi:IclR family transcriptional regulator domain-containing protein [Rosenbergiella collisarenosi]|uniref:IclR family transcriptional regulator domain-containing protein n=1 Tax=Rosenbergiella collisarenosi TaxID=1544695 RepID=UPI001BDACEEB|nr:IclR family transcriptional regulator C-terminal domain-containing protein [Rosenbergiella collisarenosi]MBT0720858.1 helix-turn-helix domain-containing protein [Rosenbergiella collisarenosi]
MEQSSINPAQVAIAELMALTENHYKGDPNFMTSLARGLMVLQAFSPAHQALSTSQISQATGLHRAAVRRCLYTLNALGFVDSHDNRYFHLLPKVLTLGQAYLQGSDLARHAQNALNYLAKEINQSCSVATYDAGMILYVARSSVKKIMRIDLGRGSRLPAYATSMGQVLLSELPEAQREEYLATTPLLPYTEFTLTEVDVLRMRLQQIKAQGYAINDQQLELGLTSLAVPMYSARGKVVAAMNVGMNSSQIEINDLKQRILPRLQRAAMDLSLVL